MNKFYVYQILDPRKNNQPFYIGKGQGNRINNTIKDSHNSFKLNVIKAIKKEGMEPIISIVKDCLMEIDAFDLEIELIEKYGRRELDEGGILANRTNGSEGSSGWIPTEENCKNMSESHKGHKHTAKTRKKMSEIHTGVKKTPKHIENIRKAKMGAKNPMYGKVGANAGNIMSDEQKKQISNSLKGHIISEETRQKMRESQIKRHAKRKKQLQITNRTI